MRDLEDEGFVPHDGTAECSGAVLVEVRKWLRARRRADNRIEVRGWLYSYHARVSGRRSRDLFRYDNNHGDFHRHDFDANGNELGITSLAREGLPTLDDVILEAVEFAGAQG